MILRVVGEGSMLLSTTLIPDARSHARWFDVIKIRDVPRNLNPKFNTRYGAVG